MTSKLFVGSLSWNTTDQSLYSAFSRFGEISEAKVAMERDDPSRSRGFGFVTFNSPDDAQRACQEMSGQDLDGRRVKVEVQNSTGGGAGSRLSGASGRHGGGDEDAKYGGGRRSGADHRISASRETQGSGVSSKVAESSNSRIYITGLPPDVTEDELQQSFGMLGTVARKKQKRGYPDQWPWKINIYTDTTGKCKGDATLTYEDPNAAQSAPSFFNNTALRNGEPAKVMTVQMAEVKEVLPARVGGQSDNGGSYGSGGSHGGGNYGGPRGRGSGHSYGGGPDRNSSSRGNYRSEPYRR